MQEPSELYGVEETSKCLSFLRLLWKFCRCIVSHVTLVSMVVAYCVLGAYAFKELESTHELKVKESIAKVRENVTNSIWAFTENSAVLEQENWTSTIVKRLIDFEKELVKKMKKEGWDGNEDPNNVQWTFAGALFYSIIVITTIGYGHIAPKTQNGKVVTIFYAIVGIPLMLLCLSNIGDVMASSFRFLYWKICCYVCTRPPKPRRSRHAHMLARSQSLRQPGRYASSNRSSAAASSFRRSIRVSQRSADSVLDTFPENAIRPSHSDTDCSRTRHSPFETGNVVDDGNLRIESLPIPSRYRSSNAADINEPSARYSEGPIASPRTLLKSSPAKHPAATTRSLDRKFLVASNDAERTPVLCNKYAMADPATDREYSLPPSRFREAPPINHKTGDYRESYEAGLMEDEVGTRPWSTAPRRCRSVEAAATDDRFNSLQLPMTRPARTSSLAARRARTNNRPYRREASSARIMSPMGFAVHRQVYVDDPDLDYDYMTNNTGDNQDATTKPVPIWLCVFLVVSYIFGGAFLFAEWETWPFLDSAYFCFITLTTIGKYTFSTATGLTSLPRTSRSREARLSPSRFGSTQRSRTFTGFEQEPRRKQRFFAVASRKRKRHWTEKLADGLRSFIAFLFSNVGIVCLVVGYTIAGAFIFVAIEGTNEPVTTVNVDIIRNNTADELWNMTSKGFAFAEGQWRSSVNAVLVLYQGKIVEAIKNDGFDAENHEKNPKWGFAGAFLYSLTVITTIGYGDTCPKTMWGKVVTIAYAIFGMPLFLLYLSNIGDILARSFKWTYARCCLCRCRKKTRPSLRALGDDGQPRDISARRNAWQMVRVHPGDHLDTTSLSGSEENSVMSSNTDDKDGDENEDDDDDDDDDDGDPQQTTVPLTLCLAIMVGYVCAGAHLFSEWESWNFLDGSYFCFVSLSTIGFGDIVPGDKIYAAQGPSLSSVFCSMYLMLGMALIAMCFNLMQEEVVAKIRALTRSVKHILGCNR